MWTMNAVLPPPPFVGLFGSHSGDWRSAAAAKFAAKGVACFDPTDAENWSKIDDASGDTQQALVDALVARQHEGLTGAAAVIFHMARRWTSAGAVDPRIDEADLLSFAARAELGFLAGRDVPTFVHIEPDVRGRNYLWALCARYRHLVRVGGLDEAIDGALGIVHSR